MNKLIENPATNQLNESMQANDIKFSFANPDKNGDFVLLHTWVKCREYFNEFLMANYHPDFTFQETYGFWYDQAAYPLDMNQTMFALKFPSMASCKTFQENIGFIHRIEDMNGIVDKTEILPVEGSKTILVVKGSKFWIQKALLTNLYTLFIKLASLGADKLKMEDFLQVRINGGTPSEITYLSTIGIDKLTKVCMNLTDFAELPTKYVDGADKIRSSYQVHGESGIIYLNHYEKSKAINQYIPKLSKFYNDLVDKNYKAMPTLIGAAA